MIARRRASESLLAAAAMPTISAKYGSEQVSGVGVGCELLTYGVGK